MGISFQNNKQVQKDILQLAIPATVENVLQTLVSFIDGLIIAKIGLVAVAAVGVASSILNVYLAMFLAIGVGATVLVAQALGEGDLVKAKLKAVQSLQITLVVGVALGLVTLLLHRQFFHWMQVDSKVLSQASQYLLIVGGAIILQAVSVTLASILRATGDSVTPMKVNAMINLLNVVLSLVLVFGFWFVPALGVKGAAIGSVLARVVGMVALFTKVQQTSVQFSAKEFMTIKPINDLLELVLPATAERLAMRVGQVVYFSFIVALGGVVFASHSIVGNIESFSYMPAYGLATACSVLIGRAIGEQNFEKVHLIGKYSSLYGVVVLGLNGIILYCGAPYFASIFTNDQAAIINVVTALHIDAFIQPVLAISLILAGALQGMNDAKTPLYSTLVGMWGVRIVTVLIFTHYFTWGIRGVWLSIGVDLYIRAFFLAWVFHIKTKNIIT
ncbi:putative efflux protein, MATE family [Granulicatella balaenopterae]|uniref:Probable multidrug resistance protein NorM n=1 Tax=Granulicatella balaenopterae TaxID=137733 RepID=A0A1H9MLS4_9LACT|nr:MATE family efflux transporter [Granulicatella balaenopterae]SER24642.1 putative efflux protein, MATE family [Granulicatella balaenopterae]